MAEEILLKCANLTERNAAYKLFEQIQRLHSDALPQFFKPPENNDAFEKFFAELLESDSEKLLFAISDDEYIAYIHYFIGHKQESIFNPKYPYAFIFQIIVDEKHRNCGVAAKLINKVIEEARAFEAIGIGIDNYSFNQVAGKRFENSGFIQNREFRWMKLT